MNKIWKKNLTLEEINRFMKGSIVENVGITFIEIGKNFITASMPVNNRTKQPLGALNGGVFAVLAETLGGLASYMALDAEKYSIGLEINVNHLKSISDGVVFGTAKPVYLGKTTQIWDITITNAKKKLICVSRLTLVVMKNNPLNHIESKKVKNRPQIP